MHEIFGNAYMMYVWFFFIYWKKYLWM